MYRPEHFDVADVAAIHDLIDAASVVHLVTAGDSFDASVIPMILDRHVGPLGSLVGHLARANPQLTAIGTGTTALAIVPGPDAYVSPSWYAAKADTGRVVPTWNYTVVHAHGRLVIHDDPPWLDRLVRRLTDRHEAGRTAPWSVDDAPRDYIDGMLRAIVGVELTITGLEGKRKLSQNRPVDRDAIVTALSHGTDRDRALARVMDEGR